MIQTAFSGPGHPYGETANAEEWRPVANGYPYEVSSIGRVRNRKGFIMGTTKQSNQMKYHVLSLTNGSRATHKQFYLHLLVAEAFLGPRPTTEHECRHLNGNVDISGVGNLKWGTPLENQNDRRAHGTAPIGEGNGRSVLTEADVLALRRGEETEESVARRLGVHIETPRRAKSGFRWAHIL